MIEAYVYTLTRVGGLKEHHGTFRCPKDDYRPCWVFDKDDGGYLTSVYHKEGVVYGQSVWFREPNKEKARKLFSERALKLKEDYLNKCIREESWILKGEKLCSQAI